MRDEQSQSPCYFKGKCNQMTLILEMSQERDSLMVSIKNQENYEYFEKVIDEQYFQDHQQISFIFQSPVQIMRYISEHFDNITINKNGEIKFSIQIIGGIKGKTITLKTDKKEMDRFDELNLKIEFLKDEFQEKLDVKEQKIRLLQENTNTLMQQIQKLKKQCQITRKLRMNSGNPFNPHNQYFQTFYAGQSLVVRRHTKDANGWYNFILNHQIYVDSNVTYKVKLLNTNLSNIYFGFGTKNIFGVSSAQNVDIMLYLCNGQIYEGGPYRDIALKTTKGEIIECSVDLLTNRASWKKGQEQIQIAVPQQMRGKPLYFVAYSCYPTDQFEIMFDQ